MNRKEVNIDLFEFQFFDKDFYSNLSENWGNETVDDNIDNPVLRKIFYGRSQIILLYSDFDKDNLLKLYNTLDFEDFVTSFEDYLIYLKNINKNYLGGLVDLSIFTFVESISYTLTYLTPDIAKTAVDIERGDLVGVSYKKSMLLDEFTSTEITESVFDSVDDYLVRDKNTEMHRMLLKEDRYAIFRPLSSWWVFLVILPSVMFFLELDLIFKYGRFVFPHMFLYKTFDFGLKQIFGTYFVDSFLWDKTWSIDHIEWTKKYKPHFIKSHIRTYVWDTRWLDVQSFWYGENARLPQVKVDYAWFYFFKRNERYYRLTIFDFFWDYYIEDFKDHMEANWFLLFYDIICFLIFWGTVYVSLLFFFFLEDVQKVFSRLKILNMKKYIELFKGSDGVQFYKDQLKIEEDQKIAKYSDKKYTEFTESLEKHRRLTTFIYEYKKKEREKEQKKKDEENRKFKF